MTAATSERGDRPFDIPLRPLTPRDALRWVASGWRDFTRTPLIGLFFGGCFAGMGWALMIAYENAPAYLLALSGGFLVVGGHSAGGHLAAMLLTTDWAARGLARDPIAGAVSLSGVHDLAPMVQFSFNADFRLDAAEAARLSPVFMTRRSRVPLVLAVGADETPEFIRQTRILWDAWPANRPPGARAPLIIPERHHFSVVVDYANPDSALTRATLALFVDQEDKSR